MVQEDLNEPYSSEEVFKVIRDMLEMEPESRPTAEEILMNPFFVVSTPTPQTLPEPIEFLVCCLNVIDIITVLGYNTVCFL